MEDRTTALLVYPYTLKKVSDRKGSAVVFMEKADHNTAEFINNTGVYNFLNGDINRAMAAFEQAAKLGNEAALANLKQLQQVLSVKMK